MASLFHRYTCWCRRGCYGGGFNVHLRFHWGRKLRSAFSNHNKVFLQIVRCGSIICSIYIAVSSYSDLVEQRQAQICCRSFNTCSQLEVCTPLDLFSCSTKYRSTSLASPMGNRFSEFRAACQCLASISQVSSERSSAPLTSISQSLWSFATSARLLKIGQPQIHRSGHGSVHQEGRSAFNINAYFLYI